MGSKMFKYSNNEDDYNSQKKAKDAAFVSYASKLRNTLSIDKGRCYILKRKLKTFFFSCELFVLLTFIII